MQHKLTDRANYVHNVVRSIDCHYQHPLPVTCMSIDAKSIVTCKLSTIQMLVLIILSGIHKVPDHWVPPAELSGASFAKLQIGQNVPRNSH